MAEEREILRYEFDISDVESKVVRLKQLQEEIAGKRQEGGDTSGLEQELMREVDGLTQLRRKQNEASHSTEELTRQKEKLANVVNLVGGSFGPLVGQLGDVVELMMSGGTAAMGLGGAMAGLAAISVAAETLRDRLAEANAEVEKLAEAKRKLIGGEAGNVEQIESSLLGMGALEAGRAEEVYKYAQGLRAQYGVPEDLAFGVAPAAFVAGASPEQAGMIALASAAGGGGLPATAQEFQQRLGGLDQGSRAALMQQLSAMGASATGRRSRAEATLEQRLMAEDPARSEALFSPNIDALVVDFAKEMGLAPEKAGPESVAKWQEQASALRKRRSQLIAQSGFSGGAEADVFGPDAGGVSPDVEIINRQLEKFDQLQKAIEMLTEAFSQQAPGGGSAPVGPGGAAVYIGTQFNAPDNRNPGRSRLVKMTPGGSELRSPMP